MIITGVHVLVLVSFVWTQESTNPPAIFPTAKEKCYGPLGCFSIEGPFNDTVNRPGEVLPYSREELETTFILHTRKNPLDEQSFSADKPETISKSNFDAGKDTKVIVHGLNGTGRKQWVKDLTKELLKRADWNVIIVIWTRGARIPYVTYNQAAANTRLVGAEIAYLVNTMAKNLGAKPEKFHIIGHSLGAHIGGYAGERLKYLGRITGLDPAGPFHHHTDPVVRLDPTDALFVDVIHTDGGGMWDTVTGYGGFGYKFPCGHVDIFPNGGSYQAGCDLGIVESFWVHGSAAVACDHLRVKDLIIESINSPSCKFRAFPCSSYEQFKLGHCDTCGALGCSYLGLDADKNKPLKGQQHLKYYLDTGGESPFCRYNFIINIQFSKSKSETEKGNLFVILEGKDGKTEELQLTKKAIEVTHGHSFGFVAVSSTNPGTIQKIEFKWKMYLFNPMAWFRDPKLYIDKITVLNGETMDRADICGDKEAIKSDSPKIFNASDSC